MDVQVLLQLALDCRTQCLQPGVRQVSICGALLPQDKRHKSLPLLSSLLLLQHDRVVCSGLRIQDILFVLQIAGIFARHSQDGCWQGCCLQGARPCARACSGAIPLCLSAYSSSHYLQHTI